MQDLKLALLQQPLVWHDRSANLAAFTAHIAALAPADLMLLPEMFTTGFTMAAMDQAEADGAALAWMQDMAHRHATALVASAAVRENGQCFNRLYLVTATGVVRQYDKRHLFGMAGEQDAYQAGTQRVVIELHGWRVCPLICYDLRFPVWSRNQKHEPYDLLLYVANWPDQRRQHWRTLLQARAIENQCWCAGLNRVGSDGNGINYAGDSLICDPLGEIVAAAGEQATVITHTLSAARLLEVRRTLPFLRDADSFSLQY